MKETEKNIIKEFTRQLTQALARIANENNNKTKDNIAKEFNSQHFESKWYGSGCTLTNPQRGITVMYLACILKDMPDWRFVVETANKVPTVVYFETSPDYRGEQERHIIEVPNMNKIQRLIPVYKEGI